MFQEVVLNAVLTVQNQTYDFMEIIGLSYQENTAKYLIVMEFAQGGSLEQHFHNVTKATSWVEIYNLARWLTQNLYSLHYVGLMHHDLHPSNVVFPDRTTRIIDVGLAKVIANSTTNDNDDPNDPRGCYGRLAYFPPECFSGEPYTTASDIYCLGTILWQIVSHVPPRGTAGALFRKDGLREDPVPGTPTGYQDIINECWSVDPDKRPTAGDVQRRIQNMMRTGPGATLFGSDVLPSRYSLLYLRALMWNRPARKTRLYVARKVNEHRRELAAEITDSLDLLEGSGSASMHRSRYYSRRQLARYYRPQVDPSHTDEVIQVASSSLGAGEPGPKTLRSARSIISRVLPRSSKKQQHPTINTVGVARDGGKG
ncbi:kinase-like domain-containing protein [Jimgerdemannia flammicorona]|uniref:non-specific serine/threonine protein kinase n=1 Tax=Jimgerdemannia flammicorona TaxID=994334 RepID=A0A433QHE9_9FUNG|nr:kinase-like domain-containing protein [Jimgerdemannia flammicorona]